MVEILGGLKQRKPSLINILVERVGRYRKSSGKSSATLQDELSMRAYLSITDRLEIIGFLNPRRVLRAEANMCLKSPLFNCFSSEL